MNSMKPVSVSKRHSGLPGSIAALLDRIHRRTSLTLKMVLLTVVVGLIMWMGFDLIQTRKLTGIFRARLEEQLGNQASEDRTGFTRYVEAHLHSAELFISQRNFSEYIDLRTWSRKDDIRVKTCRQPPDWYPRPSVLRSIVQPRAALLLDEWGRLREVYSGMRNNRLLQKDGRILQQRLKRNYITVLDGGLYVVASAHYLNSGGGTGAVLMLVTPMDEAFLRAATDSAIGSHVTALLTTGADPRILASSNIDEIPAGTSLKTLKENYLVTGEEVFDYGDEDRPVKFVSMISLEEIGLLIKSITAAERQLRLAGLPVLIISFGLLMYWVTRRIQKLTLRVSDFSQRTLGGQTDEFQKGDQLYNLEKRFESLAEEVLDARELTRKEAEERLLLQKQRLEIEQKERQLELLQSVTQAVGVGVIKRTDDGMEIVNQKMENFARMCGGLSHFEIHNAEDNELSIIDVNGEQRIFHISSPEIFTGEKIYLVRDITELRKKTAALEHMAMHDSLTGLPNRALLKDRLQQAIFTHQREDVSLALLMMDLDRFKEINDTLGHHIGDRILKEIGERLPGLLRKSDTFARLGGDEFAAVLPSTDTEHAGEAARKILDAIERPFLIDGHSLYVGASIGIVFYPDHGNDAATLLQRADVAMYVAKNAQSGLSIYSPEHDQHSIQHLVLMGELRRSIDNDSLMLYYQPKIDFKTGMVCGAEALVRWNHPQRGFIAPDEFISLAEYTGLIKPLTRWVLNEGVRQYVRWRREGINKDVVLSINVSVRNLLDAQFPAEVENILHTWGFEPECLEFEITESDVMADPAQAMQILGRLHDLGIRLSIDDFGTGYSSLAYLKKLPVDEIKIDKSFVINMTSDESDAMIVRSTIDLAHNLGLSVIAEGVECYEAWKLLEELGCDGAQGYHICAPLGARDFILWLNERESEMEKRKRIMPS